MNASTRRDTVQHRTGSHGGLYLFAILGGLVGAGYIYGIAFDDLGEEQLVLLSAAWVLPLVFGLYGFVAEKLLALVEQGDNQSIARAALVWTSALPFVGILLLLPFLFVKGRSATGIAFLAALFWAVLLIVFFLFLFPLL